MRHSIPPTLVLLLAALSADLSPTYATGVHGNATDKIPALATDPGPATATSETPTLAQAAIDAVADVIASVSASATTITSERASKTPRKVRAGLDDSDEEGEEGEEDDLPQDPTNPSSAFDEQTSSSVQPPVKDGKVVVAYFTDWTAHRYGASAIPYAKLTHINYAFALFDDRNWTPTITSGPILTDVVARAHAAGTKVAVSIGGWTGSKFFSPMAASASARATFIRATKAMIDQYHLDGIDLDWEYPGRVGMACNTVDPATDSANFLILLRELRAALGPKKFITLAVRVQPFDGPSGPLPNVKAYADALDFINIMAYDINGSWSAKTAPNAPLEASPEGGDPFSVLQSIASWTGAGFPKDKLVMGLPFYGRSLITTSPVRSSMYTTFSKTVPKGDSDDAPWAEPCPGQVPVMSGQWKWKNLREQGILTATDKAGPGWRRTYDARTQTPWLYNPNTKQFISYDDPESLTAKVRAIRTNGLAGAMVWALNQDNGELIDAVAKVRQ